MKFTFQYCGYGEEWEQRFTEYLVNPHIPVEQLSSYRETSTAEFWKSVKQGIKAFRDDLPPGVADALQRDERPAGVIVLYFPALSETGEIITGKKRRVRFVIPQRAYKKTLFMSAAFKMNDGSVIVPICSTYLSFHYQGLPGDMIRAGDSMKVAEAVHNLQTQHGERFGTYNLFSKAGKRWNKVKGKVRNIKTALTMLEGLDRLSLEHPAADAAYQGIITGRASVKEYLHLAIIESMLDDILDDLKEDVRILAEFPDTKRYLLNQFLSWEYLSMENLEKMQAKTEEPSTKGLHIGWDECMIKMFAIIRPYAESDGATYRIIKENLEANFPGMPFKIPSIRAAVKLRGIENQGGCDLD
ncbi:MAG: hypothetical protein ACOYL3_16370 [Desulfuromonadaceae bacterium]